MTQWLEHLTQDDMQAHYRPAVLEECGVYKFWADDADAEEWRAIWRAFMQLRSFYTTAAEHGEGVLIVID